MKFMEINEALSCLMYYAKECKAIREEKGLSGEQLEKLLGLPAGSVCMLEKMAEEIPSTEAVEKIISYVDSL